MNPNIKIRRVFTPMVEGRKPKPKPKIKIKFQYKKNNSLNKILKDINKFKKELFDNKSNNIFIYDFNKFFHKTKSNNKRYNNNIAFDFFERDDFTYKEDINNTNNKNKNKNLKWNYSYNNKNFKNLFKRTLSSKEYRILNIRNKKDSDIIYDWQKPRMVKILEKNAFIEEEIFSKPWKFFYNHENEKF